jgi:hypothetical protein
VHGQVFGAIHSAFCFKLPQAGGSACATDVVLWPVVVDELVVVDVSVVLFVGVVGVAVVGGLTGARVGFPGV